MCRKKADQAGSHLNYGINASMIHALAVTKYLSKIKLRTLWRQSLTQRLYVCKTSEATTLIDGYYSGFIERSVKTLILNIALSDASMSRHHGKPAMTLLSPKGSQRL